MFDQRRREDPDVGRSPPSGPRRSSARSSSTSTPGEPRSDDGPDSSRTATDRRARERPTVRVGGFELERVLADVYPILQAIDPDELPTSSRHAGRRRRAAWARRSTARSSTRRRSCAVMAAARRRHPPVPRRPGPLSDELADSGRRPRRRRRRPQRRPARPQRARRRPDTLLDRRPACRATSPTCSTTTGVPRQESSEGGKTIQILYDNRDQVIPLVIGLRQFVQTLAEAGRIPLGDGTLMAAVKGILGGEVCAELPICPMPPGRATTAAAEPRRAAARGPSPCSRVPQVPRLPLQAPRSPPTSRPSCSDGADA